jgi:hypothetical protein
MITMPAVQPGPRLDDRVAHGGLGHRARRFDRMIDPLASAARGLSLGLLVVALACAAYAAQNLHTGLRILDWAVGIGLTATPLLLLFVVLRVSTVTLVRVLAWAGLHGPTVSRRLAGTPIPALRLLGRPLVATTVGIALLVWASPTDGPLALYHALFFFEIPIVTGALVGLFVGAAMATRKLGTSSRRERVLLAAALVPALVLGAGVGAWVVLPGAGDPIIREAPETLAAIRQLDLADPSQPGPYTVVAASYGSGLDARRAEFGRDVDWVTPTVDASAALGDRGDIDGPYARWFWGFDTAHLPLNALVWYPADAPGRLPVALVVHGNHDAGDYSDPGYAYLGAHLASRGIITASIDENFLNGDAFFDYSGAEMGTRAWLLLRHLEQLRTWDSTPDHPLTGRVDLQRVALIGHSRGGEAAALAAVLAANPNGVVPGFSSIPRGFGIKAVVAFAPSDGMYRGPGSSATLRDIDYLVIQGAHDGDLPGYTGLQTYHRVALGDGGDHLKVAVFSERANHGRFNSVWNDADAGALQSWTLDRGSLLSMAEQQHLAKTVVAAFLARSLQGATGYDAFFREPRAGRAWLPDDVVETHWQSSGRVVVDAFGLDPSDLTKVQARGVAAIEIADPPLRDGATQHDPAALLSWSGKATYALPIDPSVAHAIDIDGSLVFAMAPSSDASGPLDTVIALRSADGRVASIRLSEVAPGRPLLPARIRKLAGLAARYEPDERRLLAAERFLQTYDVGLSTFLAASPEFDLNDLASVTFQFDGAGAAYLDDVAFEPGVPG